MKNKKIKNHIDDAISYIKESRRYIYSAIAIFVLSVLIGALVFPFIPSISNTIDKSLKEILTNTENLRGIVLVLFIFKNNLAVAFSGLFLGVFLGIFSLVNLFVNGSILGYVFTKVYNIAGIYQFWKILPHGIFELPAICISLGLGMKLGMFMFSKNIKKEFSYRFLNSLKVFLFIIAPLLILAAIIEGLLITLLAR